MARSKSDITHSAIRDYALSFCPVIPLTTDTTRRKKLTQVALVTASLKISPKAELQRIESSDDRRLPNIREIVIQVDANLQRAGKICQSVILRISRSNQFHD